MILYPISSYYHITIYLYILIPFCCLTPDTSDINSLVYLLNSEILGTVTTQAHSICRETYEVVSHVSYSLWNYEYYHKFQNVLIVVYCTCNQSVSGLVLHVVF
jgi:hypothetical protein